MSATYFLIFIDFNSKSALKINLIDLNNVTDILVLCHRENDFTVNIIMYTRGWTQNSKNKL